MNSDGPDGRCCRPRLVLNPIAHLVASYYLLYLPYFPLAERVQFGDWALVAPDGLTEQEVSHALVLDLATGLAARHDRPRSFPGQGAVAIPPSRCVGDGFSWNEVVRLKRALLMAVLAGNPDPLTTTEESDPNAAMAAYTADHVQAWGYPISEEGYFAEERGGMVPTLAGGYNALQEDSIRIKAPRALNTVFVRELDIEIADLLLRRLDAQSSTARRIGRSIDWLDLAWRNADEVPEQIRVAALHSGFETLLAVSGNAGDTAEALSKLLDEANARRRTRPGWTTRTGNPVEREISDLAWWFVQFAELRNAILHGDEITPDDYLDENQRPHKWVAEQTLRRAIETTARKDA